MVKARSRRRGSAAPAAKPSRKRRRGGNARAAAPAGNATQQKRKSPAHAKPQDGARPRLSPDRTPTVILAPPLASDLPSRMQAAAAAPVVGPSLRQDIPRPPLRLFALRARRYGVFVRQRGLDSWHTTQRAVLRDVRRRRRELVSRLDAYVWQPVLWPFRPAQRHILGGTLAALAVAMVALAWVFSYNALAPTRTAHRPAPPPAPPKQFTGRVVTHALPRVVVPKAAVPLPVPALRPR